MEVDEEEGEGDEGKRKEKYSIASEGEIKRAPLVWPAFPPFNELSCVFCLRALI